MKEISSSEKLLNRLKSWMASSSPIVSSVKSLRWNFQMTGLVTSLEDNIVSLTGETCRLTFNLEYCTVVEYSPFEAPEELKASAILQTVCAFRVELPEGEVIFLYEFRVPQGPVM
ncbi:MAG: hypothetical protein ACHP8B_04620 [Terriglobales bacterium]